MTAPGDKTFHPSGILCAVCLSGKIKITTADAGEVMIVTCEACVAGAPPLVELTRKEVLDPVLRWTKARKFRLMRAIERGAVTVDEACAAHKLTAAELGDWSDAMLRFGINGLKARVVLREGGKR